MGAEAPTTETKSLDETLKDETTVTDVEKETPSTAGSERASVNAATVTPAAAEPATEEIYEKGGDLARQATSASQGGHSIRQTETREDGTEYPTGLKLTLISIALCLSVFLVALDNSIIATAIPKITDAFHSLNDVGWYASAYLLTTAALQLLFGKFYTFLSIKWVYLAAIGLFEVGSLICGVAQNSVTLIIGRAVAGLGSAGIFSGALLILAHSVPLAKRPIYTGLIGGMYGIASVAGPLLGGAFTDKVTWRWCFYINLPIGAVTVVAIAFFFPEPHRQLAADEPLMQRIKRFDPFGTLVFMPAIICLLLALQWGGTSYPWNDGRIIALFVVFGVLIIAFVGIQIWQGENATVPPRIIANRTIWSSAIFSFGLGSAFFILVYYVPIWFQAVQGVSAVDSGIRNLPMLIATVLLSIIAGGAVTAVGYYTPWMIVSPILMSIGAGLISTFNPSIGSGAWIGYQILFGAGVGMGMQQPMMAAQTVLEMHDVPTGTAVIVFVQTLGGALFTSVGNSIFTNSLVTALAANAPTVDPAVVLVAGATGLQATFDPSVLPGIIEAYSHALTRAFLVSTAMAAFAFFGAIFVEWKSVKGKNVEMAMA